MSLFKTKYKSCLSTTDELQYVKRGDTPPNAYTDSIPQQKHANYKISNTDAVSGNKQIYISQYQLTGTGVNNKESIWNSYESTNDLEDGHTQYGIVRKSCKRRLLKKDGVIYDLTN